MKGRIVDIRFDTTNTIYLKQGVKERINIGMTVDIQEVTEPM